MGLARSSYFLAKIGRLIYATLGQHGQHIGHHCHCSDKKLDCDFLHLSVTSFDVDCWFRSKDDWIYEQEKCQQKEVVLFS